MAGRLRGQGSSWSVRLPDGILPHLQTISKQARESPTPCSVRSLRQCSGEDPAQKAHSRRRDRFQQQDPAHLVRTVAYHLSMVSGLWGLGCHSKGFRLLGSLELPRACKADQRACRIYKQSVS